MTGPTLRKQVVITNPQGLHMRPATAFALLAGKFQSDVRVFNEDRCANGKSVLELFTLVALPGAELTIEVSGPDAGAPDDSGRGRRQHAVTTSTATAPRGRASTSHCG